MAQAVMLVLATTLIVAAVSKLREPARFADVLAVLAGRRVSRPLAYALALGELALACALLSGVQARVVALVTLGALVAFSGALLALRADPRIRSCNCFGARSSDPRDGLVRNAALGALAVTLVVAPSGEPAWSRPLADLVAAATVALGAACCWQLAGALGLIAGRAQR